MAEYKKVQDLYQKNRRLLTEKIVSGEALDVPPVWPSMESVMTVFGGMLQSASPPDAFTLKSSCILPQDFVLITPDEIAQSKKGWPRSAPGCD